LLTAKLFMVLAAMFFKHRNTLFCQASNTKFQDAMSDE
jgi:hypothetical protein